MDPTKRSHGFASLATRMSQHIRAQQLRPAQMSKSLRCLLPTVVLSDLGTTAQQPWQRTAADDAAEAIAEHLSICLYTRLCMCPYTHVYTQADEEAVAIAERCSVALGASVLVLELGTHWLDLHSSSGTAAPFRAPRLPTCPLPSLPTYPVAPYIDVFGVRSASPSADLR